MLDIHSQHSSNPLAAIKPRRKRRIYTLGEYLHRETRAKHKHQYFNGIINKKPITGGRHNIIAANIAASLYGGIRKPNKDLIAIGSGQLIYLPTLNHAYYADALITDKDFKFWDEGQILLTNPILIVEVLSKRTEQFDWSGKFEDYKTLPSFKEYVLIRQDTNSVETRFREEPNLWRYTTYTDANAEINLQSLYCSISMKDIYKNITP